MNTFNIPNISCGHCARAVAEAIQELDPSAKVEVNTAARTAKIDSVVDVGVIRAQLAERGYPATGA
jgi:copper chaperone